MSSPFYFTHPPLCCFIDTTACTICMRIMHVTAFVDDRMEIMRTIFHILLSRLNKILVIPYMNLAFKYSIIRYKTMDQRIIKPWKNKQASECSNCANKITTLWFGGTIIIILSCTICFPTSKRITEAL